MGSDLSDPSGCWLWEQTVDKDGYGRIQLSQPRRVTSVHRLAHELFIGPIPEGYTVDHVRERGCRHKNCWNPDHLEAVTRSENSRRKNSAVTTCPWGHDYTDDNTRIQPTGERREGGRYNGRGCKKCDSIRRKAQRRGLTRAEYIEQHGK